MLESFLYGDPDPGIVRLKKAMVVPLSIIVVLGVVAAIQLSMS